MSILAPFAGKFKYNMDYYPDEVYESPRLILANVNWHYSVSTDDEYEYCVNNYDELLKKHFDLFSTKEDCIVENQPFWSLDDNEIINIKENEVPYNEDCSGKKMELLAWYEPAHFYKSDDYGIHLIPIGIVHAAEILRENCKKYDLTISRRMAIVWAMNILYCHELVHSWIEDIASLIEFSTGKDIYTKTQKRFNSYIFMEEAICNTAVYGLQIAFLEKDHKKQFEAQRKHQAENDDKKYIKDIDSRFDKEKMIKALSDFMKSQPRGYKDFTKISVSPKESFEFIRGMIHLFKYIYKVDKRREEDLYEAIDLYFGTSSHRATYSKKIEKRDIDFNQCNYPKALCERERVPIRFKDNLKNNKK